MRRLRRWMPLSLLIALAAAFLLLFLSVQRGRLHSCEQTYRSFPQMFRPFFPADRAKWRPKERENWDKLVGRSEYLAAHCSQQIQP